MAWKRIYRQRISDTGTWMLIFCDEKGNHLCQENRRHVMVPVDLDDAYAVREEVSFLMYNLGSDTVQLATGGGGRLQAVPSPAAGD